jgi:MFS family permease
MVFLGSTPIGGPIVGFISQRFGARYSIGVGAAAALVAGIFGVVKVRGNARGREEVADVRQPLGAPSLLDPMITPRAS